MRAVDAVRRYVWWFAIAGVVAALAFQWRRVGAALSQSGPSVAHASVLPPSRAIHADGRVVTYPGGQVVVGTDVPGTIQLLAVLEKTSVKKGDLLAEVEASEQKAALAEARARVSEADVDIRFFDEELDRSRRLLATAVVPQQVLDRSLHDRDAARSRRESAAATAGRLAAVVRKTRIVSPIDGVVTERFAEQGETVPAGARIVSVADLSRTRVEAEVDEYDGARVAVGQAVVIRAEGFGGAGWRGVVEEIPDTVTSRRIKPQDPGRPSDIRVLLVKIAPTERLPVKLGQRVELEIDAAP
jgi:multidrug efflux pump subunit AcrA (membrane-fusion protein)